MGKDPEREKGKKEDLRIIYLANIFFPMNRARFVQILNTCYALAEKGCKVWLLVKRTKGMMIKDTLKLYGLKEHQNLKILQLPSFSAYKSHRIRISWKGVFFIFAIYNIILLIAREGIDAVFLRELDLAGKIIKWKPILRVPVIYEAHDIKFMTRADFSERNLDEKISKRKIDKIRDVERFVFSKANGVVAVTQNMKRIIEEEFSVRTKIAIVHNGVRIDSAISNFPLNEGGGLYYIGSFDPEKDVRTSILSMKYIDREKLIIVGGYPPKNLENLKELTSENNLQSKVIFKGYLSPEEIRECLKKARILILPNRDCLLNRYFSCNIKLFEYMSAGRPIVASDLPALREILEDGENAVLVRPEDPQALAEGIKKILSNGELARWIMKKAYEDVRQYTWDRRAERIIEFIGSLKRGKA